VPWKVRSITGEIPLPIPRPGCKPQNLPTTGLGRGLDGLVFVGTILIRYLVPAALADVEALLPELRAELELR